MEYIIGTGIFLTIVLLIWSGYFAYRTALHSEARITRRRLRTLSAGGADVAEIDIMRRRTFSEIPWLNKFLADITRMQKIDRLLEQANTKMSVGFLILLSVCLATVSYTVCFILGVAQPLTIGIALLLGLMPLLRIYAKKRQRMDKFQEQLPDALELIARALKAGHAFTGGLKMVADEFTDPVGTEFEKTLDEITFGIAVDEAMKNLAARVDCPDLKFFVVSVIIQRETGGNLAEILEKIAHLIRERFKLFGRIRTLAAEGKLSATILIMLPPAIALYFFVLQPKYIELLFQDPLGIMMCAGAFAMMMAGILVMKKMIAIRV